MGSWSDKGRKIAKQLGAAWSELESGVLFLGSQGGWVLTGLDLTLMGIDKSSALT